MTGTRLFDDDRIRSIHIEPRSGHTRMIPVSGGDLACMEEFTATVTVEGNRVKLPKVEILVSVESGRPACLGIQIVGEGDLTSAVLRDLPVGAMVRSATAHAVTRFTRDQGRGIGKGFQLEGETVYTLEDVEQRSADRVKAREWMGPRRKALSGSPISDDDLRQVVAERDHAIQQGLPPAKYVAETHGVSRVTASRWFKRARDKGLI